MDLESARETLYIAHSAFDVPARFFERVQVLFAYKAFRDCLVKDGFDASAGLFVDAEALHKRLNHPKAATRNYMILHDDVGRGMFEKTI
jgi:hypothetical protein